MFQPTITIQPSSKGNEQREREREGESYDTLLSKRNNSAMSADCQRQQWKVITCLDNQKTRNVRVNMKGQWSKRRTHTALSWVNTITLGLRCS